MTDTYSTPDDTGELRSSELTGSLGERLGAQAGESFMGGMRTFTRMREYRQAESGEETLGSQIQRLQNGEDLNDLVDKPAAPIDVPIADAKARLKQQGLDGHLTLPDQPTIRQGVLDLMLQHAQERRDYDAAVSRGPQGFFPGALGMVTEIGAGMIDPINMAAFSIPVLGEARWGQMLASAGDSLVKRAGVKALQGGLQGAAGSAALIPGDWWLHTKDGQDYTMADALSSIVMGAGMGATFHAGFGSVGDVLRRSRGLPLAGSPEDLVLRGLMHGTHVPGAALESEGLGEEEIPGISAPAPGGKHSGQFNGSVNPETEAIPPLSPLAQALLSEDPQTREAARVALHFGGPIPPHPAEILADLPPAAREDVTRAAIADVIAGRPVRAGEMLAEAAKEDPRIAESVGGVEAFHGTPHDFDRFDVSRIGTGEGAQSYGHGLYFAENEAVARSYELVNQPAHLNRLAQLTAKDAYRIAEISLRPGEDVMAVTREVLQRSHDSETDPRLKQRYADALNNLEELVGPKRVGNLYKVHIAAERERFLDWDKPLNEQPAGRKLLEGMEPELREQLEERLEEAGFSGDLDVYSGNELHQLLMKHVQDDSHLPGVESTLGENPKQEPAQYLAAKGIPGIKYLDQGSRQPLRNAEMREIGEANAGIAEQITALQRDLDANRANPSMLPAYFATKEFHIRVLGLKIEQNNERLAELRAQKQEGTHNFVVFDDKLIRITHKNGKEVGLDEMKAARPESVPGPAPGTLRTGRPAVDALLHDPVVADAIANGPVDRAHDVPYEAGASEGDDPTTHLDRHLPRLAELPSGKSFDPAIPAKIHEQTEKRAMELLIAKLREREGREPNEKEMNAIYETAHHEYAEVAEDAWYRAQGVDIDEVNAWWAKQDKITEHENPKNPPPNLYKKPYPHNKVEGVKRGEAGTAAEWPTNTAVEGGSAEGEGGNIVHVRARKVSGPRSRPEATRSLFEHIAANGGLRSDDPMIPDVRRSLGRDNHFVPGFGPLIRKPKEISTAAARGGHSAPQSLDAARESAVHAGYLEDQGEHTGGLSTSTVRHLLDAIDNEARGNRVYRQGVEPPRPARDQARHEHELNGAMDKALSNYGVDLDRIPSKTRDRTLEIMDKEGVTDPLDAYERAVMEETQHGAQAGEHERIPETIPGWDVADDAGAAPGAGRAAAPGGEPGIGDAARDAGQGDRAAGRASPATARRGVADWRKFADGKRAVDDPDAVAESKAAEATPEPESVEPTKAVSAAEAEAKKADQLLADILPKLSEDERKAFETALADLKDDAEAREQIVRDGAACLAAAVA